MHLVFYHVTQFEHVGITHCCLLVEGFARAVSERFGERAMLSNAAKTADGPAFEPLTAGMSAAQRAEMKAAWPSMRTIQQLAAHERTTEALKQAETMRQTQSQGLSLQ